MDIATVERAEDGREGAADAVTQQHDALLAGQVAHTLHRPAQVAGDVLIEGRRAVFQPRRTPIEHVHI